MPEDEYTLARSVLATVAAPPPPRPWCGAAALAWSLRTLRGRLSLLPPKMEEGARARTEALVSREFRRLRLDDDASVMMDALSVRRLLAVAVL